jgi:hypothetical protein
MTTLSKEEYLKRYLSGDATDSKDKKKKKKKTKEKASAKIQPRMRIIDNDADVPSAAVPPSGATVKKVMRRCSLNIFFCSVADPNSDRRIRMILGLLDPDPLEVWNRIRILLSSSKNIQKNLDSYYFVTSF